LGHSIARRSSSLSNVSPHTAQRGYSVLVIRASSTTRSGLSRKNEKYLLLLDKACAPVYRDLRWYNRVSERKRVVAGTQRRIAGSQ
jgi:hypothetical protein